MWEGPSEGGGIKNHNSLKTLIDKNEMRLLD